MSLIKGNTMSDEAAVELDETVIDENQEPEAKTTETGEQDLPELTPEEIESERADKRQAKIDKRIGKLTKNTYRAEARAEAAEARALAAERRLNPDPNIPPESEEEDIEALVDRKVMEREQKAVSAAFTKKSETLLDKACDEGDLDIDDFIPLPKGAADAIVEMDNHKVLIHLQNNPEEIEALENMSDVRQAIEIGRLERKLSSPAEIKKSKAPSPITPIGGKKASGVVFKEDMSSADFDKWLEQQA